MYTSAPRTSCKTRAPCWTTTSRTSLFSGSVHATGGTVHHGSSSSLYGRCRKAVRISKRTYHIFFASPFSLISCRSYEPPLLHTSLRVVLFIIQNEVVTTKKPGTDRVGHLNFGAQFMSNVNIKWTKKDRGIAWGGGKETVHHVFEKCRKYTCCLNIQNSYFFNLTLLTSFALIIKKSLHLIHAFQNKQRIFSCTVLTCSFCNGDALSLLWVRSKFLDFMMNLRRVSKWKPNGESSLKQKARCRRNQGT